MSGWSEEARQRERDRINQTKPWLKSTGAKTPEGKAKVAKNARSSPNSRRSLVKQMQQYSFTLHHSEESLFEFRELLNKLKMN